MLSSRLDSHWVVQQNEVEKKGNRTARLQKIETVDIAGGTLILKPDGTFEKNRSNAP